MTATQDFVTIALPLADRGEWSALRVADATALVETLGNPAGPEMRAALDKTGVVHFMSINLIGAAVDESGRSEGGFLLIEATVDGPADAAIVLIERHCGDLLFPAVAVACGLSAREDLLALLRRHQRGITHKPLRWPGRVTGLPFLGVPGLTVAQIRDHVALVAAARAEVEAVRAETSLRGPQSTFERVHAALGKTPALAALLAKPQPALAFTERTDAPWLDRDGAPAHPVLGFIGHAAQLLLLLLVVPLLAAFALAACIEGAGWPPSAAALLHAGMVALFPALLFVGLLVGGFAWALRRDEKANVPIDATPDPALIARMMARENAAGLAQNHMISVTTLRPGLLRRLALMLTFHAIALAPRLGLMRVGFLASIGTIHSARWVVLPRTRQLVFLSNYDGSWESYLEDFITKASTGVTGVWSNVEGFPRTRFLFLNGAQDGDRMKRFARRSMRPTAFWYSAFPTLGAEQMRKHAIIVSGLRSPDRLCRSPSDAEAWLDLFSTIPRPDYGLEYEDIQTLMFGGLRHHPRSRSLALHFGAPRATSADRPHPFDHVQQWLADLDRRGVLSFGDKPAPGFVANIAFSAAGLRKLGLDRELAADPDAPPAPCAEQGFPAPFALGMTHPSRQRLLGDPERLAWSDASVDAVLMLYAADDAAVARFASEEAMARQAGLDVATTIDTALRPFDAAAYAAMWNGQVPAPNLAPARDSGLTVEPFGFVDGISQPVVRGFPGRAAASDPVHGVEPGEFLLGYRDNRGYFPPSPQVARPLDAIGMHPEGILPSVPAELPTRFPVFAPDTPHDGAAHAFSARDFGRNGSYLVIRQLAQDVAGFGEQLDRLCADVAAAHDGLNPHPTNAYRAREWIAAKLVGRWRDGSPLVDHPFAPAFKGRALRAEANQFLYRDEDPQGMRCPFGAHVRRAFPRDSMAPTDPFELSVTNRHRLLRRGRPYLDEHGNLAGTLFLCFNADLERQFEFVQQTWVGAPTFHGLEAETDPFAMQQGPDGDAGHTRLSIPGPAAPLVLEDLRHHVKLRGGGYFFLPGRHAIWFLAGRAWAGDKAGELGLTAV